MLPDMSGYEVCKAIARREDRRHGVLMAHREGRGEVASFGSVGATDYVASRSSLREVGCA